MKQKTQLIEEISLIIIQFLTMINYELDLRILALKKKKKQNLRIFQTYMIKKNHKLTVMLTLKKKL